MYTLEINDEIIAYKADTLSWKLNGIKNEPITLVNGCAVNIQHIKKYEESQSEVKFEKLVDSNDVKRLINEWANGANVIKIYPCDDNDNLPILVFTNMRVSEQPEIKPNEAVEITFVGNPIY
jgi:hypothetical protein